LIVSARPLRLISYNLVSLREVSPTALDRAPISVVFPIVVFPIVIFPISVLGNLELQGVIWRMLCGVQQTQQKSRFSGPVGRINMVGLLCKDLPMVLAFLILQVFLPPVELNAQEREPSARGGKDGAAESTPSAKPNLINENLLTGLPLNGRSYTQLVTLEAGVSDASSASSSRGVSGGSLTVSGSRSSSNTFLLDGTNILDSQNRPPRSAAGVQLGSDSVLQVQVFSANYGAEYGRNNGGVLNSITRSGSDEFHGTFFEYFRNSKLDARNFFDRGANPPPFKRNQFGFTLSGPVRKKKTYFMGSYEAMLDRLNDTQIDIFPDAEARQGIITDASGRVIRTLVVSPRVKPYLDLIPIPNSVRVGEGLAQNSSPQFLPTNENFFTVRLDHELSDRDSLFGRYTFDDATSDRPGDTYAFRIRTKSRQHFSTLVGSHIFSPSLLASSRLGFTRLAIARQASLGRCEFVTT
jgi:hypothetical protein